MHGDHKSSKHRELMEKAEAKQRESMQKESDAEELETQAVLTERNVHRLCDALLYNGRQRGMVERDRAIEERRVAEMGEKLSKYKREAENYGAAAQAMRDEEARLEAAVYKLEEEAEEADQAAEAAEEEAERLERELKSTW